MLFWLILKFIAHSSLMMTISLLSANKNNIIKKILINRLFLSYQQNLIVCTRNVLPAFPPILNLDISIK